MLLVSWWSLNCVSVVVGVLVALWWCVRSVLVACLCGVPVVSCGVVGLVFFFIFFHEACSPVSTKLVSTETHNFAIGVVFWVNSNLLRHLALIQLPQGMA